MDPWLAVSLSIAAGAAVAAAGVAVYLRVARRRARELEERIRNAEREAFVGTLATGLAHEIRNPLSTLNINLQLLQEDWANAVTSKEQRTVKRIETILRESRRLEQTLNDFLRFAGKHPLDLAPHNVNDVLDEILDFIGPEARQRKIEVRKLYDASLQAIPLDVSLFKQALINVLRNAEEAMPGGGELIVRTSRNKRVVHIDVTDTGTGIPAEIRDKIFQVYFTTKTSGSGLGLPTAKKIIEEHHGAIEVQSEPGKGTCFSIRLPLSA